MLVSIREAATIQLLSLPTAVCWRNYLARSCLSTFLPLRGLIEELQSFFYRAFLLIEIIFPRGNHADRFPGRDPLQLVSRPDSVLVGDGFGHCQLQLACNLRHILTISRILSLLKILQSCCFWQLDSAPPWPSPKEHFCLGLIGNRIWRLAWSGAGAVVVAHVLP